MRRDWVLIVAVVLVAASTVIASFTAQAGLGERAGWVAYVTLYETVDLRLSWLLPLTVDAYGVAATRIATNKRRYSSEVRQQAFGHALAAVAVSVVANAVYHLIEAEVIDLGSSPWVLVVAVSIVPPVALGGLAHLLSVAARDEVETATTVTVTDVTTQAVPATVGTSPTVAPESVTVDTLERVEVTPSPTSATADPTPVPAPIPGVPPQVDEPILSEDDFKRLLGDEPANDDQVQPGTASPADAPYYPLALNHFLSDVLQGEPPPVRTIKERLSVGTDRARRLQAYLGGLVEVSR